MSGWQPIETAPKDGTIIVLYTAGGNAFVARWEDAIVENAADETIGAWRGALLYPDCWTDGICWERNEDDEPSDPPAHWCPLPDPPQS